MSVDVCARQLASQTSNKSLGSSRSSDTQSNGRAVRCVPATRPRHHRRGGAAAAARPKLFVEMPPDGSGAFSVWREREAATAVVKQLGAATNAVSKQRQATAPLQLPPHPDAPQSLPITIVGTGPYRLTFPANPVPGREFAEGRAECLPARVDEMLFAGAASAGWRVVEAKRGSAKKSQWLYLDPAGNSNTSKTTAIEKASAAAGASSSSATCITIFLVIFLPPRPHALSPSWSTHILKVSPRATTP